MVGTNSTEGNRLLLHLDVVEEGSRAIGVIVCSVSLDLDAFGPCPLLDKVELLNILDDCLAILEEDNMVLPLMVDGASR